LFRLINCTVLEIEPRALCMICEALPLSDTPRP
jgi:hypothetical protein